MKECTDSASLYCNDKEGETQKSLCVTQGEYFFLIKKRM